MYSRRKFLQHSVAATTAAALLEPIKILAAENPILSFDLHSHPGIFYAKGTPRYPGDASVMKTVTEMNSGKLSGAFVSLVADTPILEITATGVHATRRYAAGEAWNEYRRQMIILNELFKTLPATRSTKLSDLDAAAKSNKVAAFLACEGGDFLEGQAGYLDQMYEEGIRSIQLVHYAQNELGDLQTEPAEHDGLSAAGKEVVKKMDKLGMVIDMAHASFKTVQDVATITQSPIILSHSILKMEEDRPIAKRAISRDHAKLIASTGGVVGAWPSGFNKSFDEFVTNTIRLADVVGIDHVGLGTDMDSNFKPVLDSYLQLPQWTEALKAKGLTDQDVRKVLGGNVRRVLSKVLK